MAGPGTALLPTPLSALSRDSLGFIEGQVPDLTQAQVSWIISRVAGLTDEGACIEAGLDPVLLEEWKADPGFASVLSLALDNRREGFKLLGTYLLPKALRKIDALISSSDTRANARGITLLLRSQGMLVDKVQKADKSALQELFESLRATKPTTIIDGSVRVISAPSAIREDEDDE